MGGSRTITAAAGRVRWGYHDAGHVTSCTVTRIDGRWALTATLAQGNAYRLAQRPLLLVVPHQNGEWRWPIEALELETTTVRATLGNPQ